MKQFSLELFPPEERVKQRNVDRPVGVDLFAGAGGLSLGFEQAGFDVVAAVEIDPIHAATHAFNFPRCAVLCKSVTVTTAREIRDAAGLSENEPIDVVFGGAPCQGFSLIGKRALEDPRNQLVHHFVRLVLQLRARYFVFENVKGLTIGQHRRFLDEVISAFKAAEYDVLEPYQVLNAANFGVPQNRERLFLIGAKRGLPLPKYPSGGAKTTVWDAIGDLPDANEFPELVSSDAVEATYKTRSNYAKRLRGLLPDESDFSYPRIYSANRLTSSMRTEHTTLSQRRFRQTKPGAVEPISRFLKLDEQGVCNTLRAGTDSARGAFTSPRPIHPRYSRVITVREAARLHSYPDWFRFHTTKWHGFRQIGNSVPPLLGRAVASALMKAMNISPKRPISSQEMPNDWLLKLDMKDACRHFELDESPIATRTRIASEPEAQYEVRATA